MCAFSLFKKKTETDMWLIAGLGNPGDKYSRNRHNAGFMAIDEIAHHHNFPAFKAKFQGVFSTGTIGGEKVMLLKPMTMMNNSGQSVSAAAKFYKIPAGKIIVFHDEIDLQSGKLKIKKGGGAAGHNGLKSCDAHLGTKDYWRVRIGVGHPGDKEMVYAHVLGNFSRKEEEWLEPMLESIAKNATLLTENKINNLPNAVQQT